MSAVKKTKMSKISALITYLCGDTGWKIILECDIVYNSVIIIYDIIKVVNNVTVMLATTSRDFIHCIYANWKIVLE